MMHVGTLTRRLNLLEHTRSQLNDLVKGFAESLPVGGPKWKKRQNYHQDYGQAISETIVS